MQPRLCHCGQDPCPHELHVHADMPGLAEQDDGLYAPIARFKRSVEELHVDQAPAEFRHALAVFIADHNGGSYRDAVLPDVVYRAQAMQLSWHNTEGDLVVCIAGGNPCFQ